MDCRAMESHGTDSDETAWQQRLRTFLRSLPKPCALFAAIDDPDVARALTFIRRKALSGLRPDALRAVAARQPLSRNALLYRLHPLPPALRPRCRDVKEAVAGVDPRGRRDPWMDATGAPPRPRPRARTRQATPQTITSKTDRIPRLNPRRKSGMILAHRKEERLMHIGVTEILLIVCFVLIVFGAKRIPELARAIGRASVEYKKAKNALAEEGKELLDSAEKAAEKESAKETQEKAG